MEVFNMEMIKNIPAVYFFKYHHGHKELKGTHMCFFDDLMVLCNGDKVSLNVVMKSHEEFNNVFGLFPNMNKSIIFFGSLNDERRNEILDVLPFKIRKLPMKYLGVPLISKTLGINECIEHLTCQGAYVDIGHSQSDRHAAVTTLLTDTARASSSSCTSSRDYYTQSRSHITLTNDWRLYGC
ncbi:hypothetical protein Tco_0641548 [Tanacetum coccineum]